MPLSSNSMPRPHASSTPAGGPVTRSVMSRLTPTGFIPSGNVMSSTPMPTSHNNSKPPHGVMPGTIPQIITPSGGTIPIPTAPPYWNPESYGPFVWPYPTSPCAQGPSLPQDPCCTYYNYYHGMPYGADARRVEDEEDSLFAALDDLGDYHTSSIGCMAHTAIASMGAVDPYSSSQSYTWSSSNPGYSATLSGYQAYLMINRPTIELENPKLLDDEAKRSSIFRMILLAERAGGIPTAPPSGGDGGGWGLSDLANQAANTASGYVQTTASQYVPGLGPTPPAQTPVAPTPVAHVIRPTYQVMPTVVTFANAMDPNELARIQAKYRRDANGNPWEVGLAGLPRNLLSR